MTATRFGIICGVCNKPYTYDETAEAWFPTCEHREFYEYDEDADKIRTTYEEHRPWTAQQ